MRQGQPFEPCAGGCKGAALYQIAAEIKPFETLKSAEVSNLHASAAFLHIDTANVVALSLMRRIGAAPLQSPCRSDEASQSLGSAVQDTAFSRALESAFAT